ncbi:MULTISPECIES: hypothetical protein [Actinoplanes]|uniref:hypothetical protein n=1 Tax=Actinoplanes TaxID=1865 RepID=UPI0005F2DCD2|nr:MULTISPECIES: hypothetical protein [Actinoplanes]
MPDDEMQSSLQAYADHLQRGATMAPATEIRRRGDRRRRNRAAGGTFAAVLVAAAGVGLTLDRGDQNQPVLPAGPSASASIIPYTPGTPLSSDVSQLDRIGVDLGTGTLIDVADDGADRWMQIGADDGVDFTGTAKDASTRMSLRAAPVMVKNQVLIIPVARPDSCVTAVSPVTLALQPCRDGETAQIWEIVPAGDSGQFELSGEHGILRVDGTLVASGGRSGMQTIPF